MWICFKTLILFIQIKKHVHIFLIIWKQKIGLQLIKNGNINCVNWKEFTVFYLDRTISARSEPLIVFVRNFNIKQGVAHYLMF